MRDFVKSLLLFAVFAGALARDSITVDPDKGEGSEIDWSKTDLMTIYCVAESKECPGHNLGEKKFAATIRQCMTRCSVDFTCLAAFYDKDKNCQLKTHRCAAEELKDNSNGVDLYRLKRGESCPADRPEYVAPSVKYTNTFCMLRGKSCVGHDLYKKPQNIYPLEQCLAKCAKITTCASVDYKNNKCSPKSYHCSDDQLQDDPDMYNAMRLVEGVDACPDNRGITCPDHSTAVGTECVCDDGYLMKNGKCVIECGENSKPVGDKCECLEEFEKNADGKCVKTSCPVYAHRVDGKCKCVWQTYPDGTCGDRYCKRENLNCPGYDITLINVASYDDCKKACDVEERCKSIHVRLGTRQCWLKHYRCDNNKLTITNDGVDFARMADGEECYPNFIPKGKFCARRNMNCPGNDIRHVTASEERCKYYCTMNPDCKSIHWRDDNCWLKRVVCSSDQLTPTLNGHDLVKIGENDDCSKYEKPKQDYCLRENMNCPGHDIHHLTNVETLKECQDMCDFKSQCVSIHYNNKHCWLKRYVCSSSQLTFTSHGIDAVKIEAGASCDAHVPKKNEYCVRAKKDCTGHDLVKTGNVESLEDCERLCDYRTDCVSIHYNSRTCWLKRYKCLDHELKDLASGTDAYKGKCDEKVEYSYCRREQLDCPGSDLSRTARLTEQQCLDKCSEHPQCLSIQYRGYCWLKKKVCSNSELKHLSDGVDFVRISTKSGSCNEYSRPVSKYCTRDLMYCPGGDLQYLRNIESLERCQYHCDYKTGCIVAEYDTKSKICWMKKTVCEKTQLKFMQTRKNSVRIGVDESCDKYFPVRQEYCTRHTGDCERNDIAYSHPVDSLADCQYWCDFHDECKSIQWRTNKQCWIKNKVCERWELTERPEGYYDSYKAPCIVEPQYDYCRRDHLECHHYVLKYYAGYTEEKCIEKCSVYPKCKTVLFRTNGQCWLKTKVCTNEELYPYVTGTDLVKIPKGGSCEAYKQPQHKYCIRNYQNCWGRNWLQRTNVENPLMCQYWCDFFTKCHSYDYRQDKVCWLETNACTGDELTPDPTYFNAIKVPVTESCSKHSQPVNDYCTRPLLNCVGNDIKYVHKIESLDICQYLCDFKSACKSVHYDQVRKICWLKKLACPREKLTYNVNGIDSVKVEKGASCADHLAPKTEYCIRENKNCAGHDIQHSYPVATINDCQYMCNMKPDCLSIHFLNKHCWLKRKRCEIRELSQVTNGGIDAYKAPCIGKVDYDYCRRENMDCVGSDIKLQGGYTEKQCTELCDIYPDCLSIQFRGTSCWIKRKVCENSELTPRLTGVDLIKVAKGASCDAYKEPEKKWCLRNHYYCSGGDIRHIGGVPTKETCQYFCAYHKDCVSYHYKQDKNCWLERRLCTNDQLVAEIPSADTVKVDLWESCEPYQPTFNYCDRKGKNCAGRDIFHRYPVESLEVCKELCNYKSECKSVHWNNKHCWLKRHRCEKRELTDAATGVDSYKAPCIVELSYDYCRRDHLECPGSDILHRARYTEKQCQELCDMYPDCKSIHFRTDGNCWIKRKLCENSELIPRIIGVDLVRVAKGASCDAYKPPEKKWCVRDHHYCSGGDIHHRGGVPSKAMCQHWCAYHKDCVSYHYKQDKNCWLERRLCTNDQLVPELVSADTVKVGLGESCEPYQPKFKYCTRLLNECPGYDILHRGSVPNQETCQMLCDYKSDCKSIHYRPEGNCWIKRYACPRDKLTFVTYGLDAVKVDFGTDCKDYVRPKHEYCVREGKECAGADLGVRAGVKSVDDCQSWCDYRPDCKAYHYRSNGYCWIKNRVCESSKLTTRIGGYQNYKKEAGQPCN